MIRRMKKCLKMNETKNASTQFWLNFAKIAAPLAIVAFAAEFVLLDLLGTSAPVWQPMLAFIVFVVSFSGYFYACYHIEGRRLFGDLQRWIRYRKNPQGYSKPIDAFQVLKMAVPPLVTLGSAILKIYYG